MGFKDFANALIRRKKVDVSEDSQLNRCLSTYDLALLGVGGTLGLGVYVLAGQVASTKAGPSVVLSFLIAAVASVFSGLCYAEFGARVPRAGSAYIYSYVTVGEFMAFVIGWNLILEYVIGTASVARGYSGYLDNLVNHTIETHLREWMPMGVSWLSSYPDLFALGITLFLAAMLAVGVRESTRFNNVFTALNLLVVLYVVIVGAFKADIKNWQLRPQDIPGKNKGKGGFFPYGIGGTLNGAASCFYGFVGFDCIATMGEEVRNPRKAIPIAIVVSLTVVFLAYFGVSVIETLVWPYYDQNVAAPLPYVFDRVGWPIAKWVVSIGALTGLSTSLLGGMFPLPRVLYAMGSDGLIFRFLARVHPRLKTPLIATLLSGVFAGLMAMMFNVEELANMMSIGTLLAYSLVAVSVLMLRYEVIDKASGDVASFEPDAATVETEPHGLFTTLLNLNNVANPTRVTSKAVKYLTFALAMLFCIMNGVLVFAEGRLFSGELVAVIPFAQLCLLSVLCIVCIARQPSASTDALTFAVPFVPYIPMFNMFINLYLMMRLPVSTWARFGVWMFIGLFIYFAYGIWNSSQRKASPPVLRDMPSTESVSSGFSSDGVAGGTK